MPSDLTLGAEYNHDAYVHVFVESLRRAESAGVCEAQVHVLRGVVAQVGTRTEDDVVYEIVLVEASSQQEAPLTLGAEYNHDGMKDVILDYASSRGSDADRS